MGWQPTIIITTITITSVSTLLLQGIQMLRHAPCSHLLLHICIIAMLHGTIKVLLL